MSSTLVVFRVVSVVSSRVASPVAFSPDLPPSADSAARTASTKPEFDHRESLELLDLRGFFPSVLKYEFWNFSTRIKLTSGEK